MNQGLYGGTTVPVAEELKTAVRDTFKEPRSPLNQSWDSSEESSDVPLRLLLPVWQEMVLAGIKAGLKADSARRIAILVMWGMFSLVLENGHLSIRSKRLSEAEWSRVQLVQEAASYAQAKMNNLLENRRPTRGHKLYRHTQAP